MKNNTTPFALCNKVLRLGGAALLFIALCLLLSCNPSTPSGSGENAGAASSGYYYDNSTNTYHIYTEQGLKAWAESENCLTANVKLERDITMTKPDDAKGSNWTGVGTGSVLDSSSGYAATFDGNNHTISGLQIDLSSSFNIGSCHGFFRQVSKNGTIKNLNLAEVDIYVLSNYIGAIAGYSFGKIENCSVSGTRVRGYAGPVGGIVGTVDESGSILNCKNECSIISYGAEATVGGIVGSAERGSRIFGCDNYGDLTSEGDLPVRCGGIAGRLLNSYVDNCTNNGNITAKNTAKESRYKPNTLSVGGIVGHNEGTGTVSDCSIALQEGKITIDASYYSSGLNEDPFVGDIVGQGSVGLGNKGDAEIKEIDLSPSTTT